MSADFVTSLLFIALLSCTIEECSQLMIPGAVKKEANMRVLRNVSNISILCTCSGDDTRNIIRNRIVYTYV